MSEARFALLDVPSRMAIILLALAGLFAGGCGVGDGPRAYPTPVVPERDSYGVRTRAE